MTIKDILSESCPLEELRRQIFNANGKYCNAPQFHNFYLSHNFPIIYRAARSIIRGNIKGILSTWIKRYRVPWQLKKYAEIGSSFGNSAVTVALANPAIQIFCYDNPNNGWGGQFESEIQLQINLIRFASKRHSLYLGDSHSDDMIKKIYENGPYDIFLVDGDHSEEGAYRDLVLAHLSLKPGGILIFDDIVHHRHLSYIFSKYVSDLKPRESVKLSRLTDEERNNNYTLRGVGIAIK